MITSLQRLVFLLALGLFVLPLAALAAEPVPQKIGMGIQVYTEGFFSHKIVRVAVTQVNPGSQAQAAGIAVGDELLRVDDVAVAGADAARLRPHMEFVPGVAKQLRLRRHDGSEYEARLVRQLPTPGS